MKSRICSLKPKKELKEKRSVPNRYGLTVHQFVHGLLLNNRHQEGILAIETA